MACLEMYNNSDHKGSSAVAPPPPTQPMSPRISFSNDFAESSSSTQHQQYHQQQQQHTRESPPVSSDFEFNTSVSSSSSLSQRQQLITASADELFFKGRILPLKDNQLMRTLRDELLAGDEDDDGGFSLKPPVLVMKGGTSSCNAAGRWKGFLGLRKSHIIGSRKPAAYQPAATTPKLFDEPTSNMFKEDPNHSQLQHQINPPQSTYSTQRIMMCREEGTSTTAIASTGPADDIKM